MKTLIINGSTRRGGDTDALVDALCESLQGEIMTVTCDDAIAPCMDCRYCMTHDGCVIHDRMQEVYRYLDACDNVVLASPIWFASLSAPMLAIASRLQTRFMASRRNSEREPCKNGVIILVGGMSGTEVAAEKSAKFIMRYMNVRRPITLIRSMNTDVIPAKEDAVAMKAARDAARQLNEKKELQ